MKFKEARPLIATTSVNAVKNARLNGKGIEKYERSVAQQVDRAPTSQLIDLILRVVQQLQHGHL
jgi:hypothetical protein